MSLSTCFCQERVLYFYCPTCQQAHRDQKLHPDHGEDCLNFPGVQIIQDFVSEEEEKHIVEEIYKVPWIVSQSGRRKQVWTLFYFTSFFILLLQLFFSFYFLCSFYLTFFSKFSTENLDCKKGHAYLRFVHIIPDKKVFIDNLFNCLSALLMS